MIYSDAATGIAWYGREGEPNRALLNPTAEKRRSSDEPDKEKNREVADRATLASRLLVWRRCASKGLGPFYPPDFIINDKGIVSLSLHAPGSLSSKEDVARVLGETEQWSNDWAEAIFDLVKQYDDELTALRPVVTKKKSTRTKKRAKS